MERRRTDVRAGTRLADFEVVAREGEALVKTLKSKVGSFNRAVDRERARTAK